MNIRFILIWVSINFFTCVLYGQKIVPSDMPNATQKGMVERGYGMFIHFGINTFA